MKLLVAFFFLFFVLSCRPSQQVVLPVETRTTIVERLVAVETPADSAWLHAWLECDSSYNIILNGINEHKTKGMETTLQLADSKLSYKVVRIADKVYIPAKDSIIIKQVPYPVEVLKEINRLTGWQYFQVWVGRVFLALLAAYLFFKFLSKK